ncbi:molybdopterin-dependent oxidoreductase [Chryseobacterium gallinarum]|uniref:Molybdopterin-dependent oxidoreductase n=1 Tax=Chryseobacterium gallinarum TaxID=1324352 RepID=A0ABX6KPV1_CHRGL|nr:molybdopterin-dependent oxidoreductase [Chryseobacterium gallinarum]QIY90228.1 molybdopterin-dependent oxidoreductase [Chryseobacterium gallinarum]
MKKMLPVAFLLVSGWMWCQSGFKLKVGGEVSQPLELTVSDLSKMPEKETSLRDKEGKTHTYTGVSLQDILAKAGVPSGKELHGENLAKYVLAKCTDGYQVLFSLAELDASISDKNVIIAYKMDGNPLPASKGPLRLIAEGEKKPARSTYQLASLSIGHIKN